MRRSILLVLLFAIGFSCESNKNKKEASSRDIQSKVDLSDFQLKPGDLLFQDSDCGPFCDAIEKVTFGIDGAKFSHVGLVIPKKNNKLVVIEAITNGVVETPLDSFLSRSYDRDNNSKVVVGRLKEQHQQLISDAINFSKTKIGLPYDSVFDITNNKYYCSELIYDAFKFANNNSPIFELQPMTYLDPDTNETFAIWKDYFEKLNVAIPEGELGLNPGSMSRSNFIDIVHFYGRPQGYKLEL